MNKYFIIGFVFGSLFDLFCDLCVIPLKRKWKRDCNYDCSKCRVWDCERFDCINQIEKIKRKEHKNEIEK